MSQMNQVHQAHQLRDFATMDISWDLTPEHAVTMYLEWGNNDWHSEYPPVRSKSDESVYFVVDTWGRTPVIRLVRRNCEECEDIFVMDMPEALIPAFEKENHGLKGISAPQGEVRRWLRSQMGYEQTA